MAAIWISSPRNQFEMVNCEFDQRATRSKIDYHFSISATKWYECVCGRLGQIGGATVLSSGSYKYKVRGQMCGRFADEIRKIPCTRISGEWDAWHRFQFGGTFRKFCQQSNVQNERQKIATNHRYVRDDPVLHRFWFMGIHMVWMVQVWIRRYHFSQQSRRVKSWMPQMLISLMWFTRMPGILAKSKHPGTWTSTWMAGKCNQLATTTRVSTLSAIKRLNADNCRISIIFDRVSRFKFATAMTKILRLTQ